MHRTRAIVVMMCALPTVISDSYPYCASSAALARGLLYKPPEPAVGLEMASHATVHAAESNEFPY